MLADTKSVQKEINHLSGVLDRTFAVTDELIFKDAKRDEAVRRAYKLLAALHDVSLFVFLPSVRTSVSYAISSLFRVFVFYVRSFG